MNLDTNFFDIKISNETVIRDIPNDLKHQVIEEFRILKFNLQKVHTVLIMKINLINILV